MPDEGNWRDDLDEFCTECSQALDEGERQYGDTTMEGGLDNIIRQAMSELVDTANYSFMLWRRLRALAGQLDGIEREVRDASTEDSDALEDAE